MTTERQRKLNRERQQRFRDRKKQDSREAASEAFRAKKVNEEGLRWREGTGQCFMGEVSPGVDATTIADALQVAREMARALNEPDVQPGESLIQFERRVWYAWVAADGPFLIRKSQTLRRGWGRDYFLSFGGFDKSWIPLPGSDAVVDVSSLPALPSVLS